MTLAVARLDAAPDVAGAPAGGTAFAIAPGLALTALHCLRDTEDPDRRHDEVLLYFGDAPPVRATYADGDRLLDVALLRLIDPLPVAAEPLPLTAECFPHDLWYSIGFPHEVDDDGVGGFALSGRVTGVDMRILDGAEAIQLHCEQAATGMPLSGASGGPVFVGRPYRVAALVRWNIERRYQGPALGGEIYATALAAVGQRFPAVAELLLPSAGPAPRHDPRTEDELMHRLPLAAGGRLRRSLRRTAVLAIAAVAVLVVGGGTAVGTSVLWNGDGRPPRYAAGEPTASATTASPTPFASPSTIPSPTPSSPPPWTLRPRAPGPPKSTPSGAGAAGTSSAARTTAPPQGISLMGAGVNVVPRSGDVTCGEGATFVFTASVTSRNAGVIEYSWYPDPETSMSEEHGTMTFPAPQTRRVRFTVPREGEPGETLHAGVQFHITSPESQATVVGDEYYVTCQ